MAAIRLKSISKIYPDPHGGEPVEVLNDLDLEVAAGESVAIVGPSGCGKSTLLNIIGALDTADGGSVEVLGQDLSGLSEKELATLRAEKLGFVFQLHHLLPQLSVLENVLLPTLALADRPSRISLEERAAELLEVVGLAARAGHRPGQLSGGERQRAAVVRALINKPEIVLADEPTGALDSKNASALAGLLGELVEDQGVTLVLVTHDPGVAAKMGRTMELGGE